MAETKKTLRDVLPREFHLEHTTVSDGFGNIKPSPAAKLLDVEVVEEVHRTQFVGDNLVDSPNWREWPGKHGNVHVWWVLANGKAVGFNEGLRGWSFPVITYKESK